MPEQVTLLRVFIATPGGLETERSLFRQTLHEYNESEALEKGILFVPVGWEITLPGLGRPQELINRDLRRCDYCMLFLHDRWGTPTEAGPEHRFTSGVEEEFRLAQQFVADEQQPMRDIIVLFKAVDPGKLADPGPQLSKVLAFKQSIESSKELLFGTFDSTVVLQQQLKRCLAKWLRQTVHAGGEGPKGNRSRGPSAMNAVPTYVESPQPLLQIHCFVTLRLSPTLVV